MAKTAKYKELPWQCYGCKEWVTAYKVFWTFIDKEGHPATETYCPHCIAAIKDSYHLRQYQGHA